MLPHGAHRSALRDVALIMHLMACVWLLATIATSPSQVWLTAFATDV